MMFIQKHSTKRFMKQKSHQRQVGTSLNDGGNLISHACGKGTTLQSLLDLSSSRSACLENVVMLGIICWMFGYNWLHILHFMTMWNHIWLYHVIPMYNIYIYVIVWNYFLLLILNIWYHIHKIVISCIGNDNQQTRDSKQLTSPSSGVKRTTW